MSGYIMDHFITRERAKTLIVFSKVYVFPLAFSCYYWTYVRLCRYKTIPLSFLSSELAIDDTKETLDFLDAHIMTTFTNPNSADKDKIVDFKSVYTELIKVYDDKYKKVNIRGAI